ncbi:hypothetical protein ACFLZ7_03975 [Nanoarchaeota archaeon]
MGKRAKKTIDSFFSGLEQDKANAQELIKKGKPTEKELNQIARAIYFSTFNAMFQTDRDTELASRLLREIQSYRLPANERYLEKFAGHAFDFASNNSLVNWGPNKRGQYVWRVIQDVDVKSYLPGYKKEFKEKAEGIVRDLRVVLGSS